MTEQEDKIISSLELRDEIKDLPEETFFKTSHEHLDRYVPMKGGDLILIGGRAGEGKSQLCVSLTKRFSKEGHKCLWFSVELTPREFVERFGNDLPLFYIPRKITAGTLQWIGEKIDEAIEKHGVNIVFIDSIQMVADEKVLWNQNSQEIIAARVDTIKRWAIDKNICILATSEVKQETNSKRGKGFDLSDYKGSSSLGHRADTALIIHRTHGKKSEVALNDILNDTLELSTNASLHILKCRRSGVMFSYIKMHLTSSGDYVEGEM